MSGFNRGLINQFVLKTKADFFEEIKQYAQQLEMELFDQISKNLIDAVGGGEDSIFYDPVFISFFKDLLQKHNIIEFYLLDPSGSYLLVDEAGEVFWLLVKNEADMQVLTEVASDYSADDNDPLLSSIKSRKKLAFFLNPEEQLTTPESWHLEDAQVLKGRDTYYYSIVKGTNEYYYLKNKILPYSSFLKD